MLHRLMSRKQRRNRKQLDACHPFFSYLADHPGIAILPGLPSAVSAWIVVHYQLPEWCQMNTKAPAIEPTFTLARLEALLLSRPADFRKSAPSERRSEMSEQALNLRCKELGLPLRCKEQPFFLILREHAWTQLLHDICKQWPGLCNAAQGIGIPQADSSTLPSIPPAQPSADNPSSQVCRWANDRQSPCQMAY